MKIAQNIRKATCTAWFVRWRVSAKPWNIAEMSAQFVTNQLTDWTYVHISILNCLLSFNSTERWIFICSHISTDSIGLM